MTKQLIFSTVAAFALTACASSPAPKSEGPASAAAPAAEAEAKAEHKEEKHEHKWPMAEMEAVHDVLSPAWHGAVEKENDKAKACAAVPGLTEAATKLAAAKVPADHADKQAAFTEKAAAFQAAIATFGGQCTGDGPADLMAAFSPIHDAFHGVMDLFKKAEDEHKGEH